MLARGIRGTVASVKWSYFTAAAINGYAVSQDRATKAWSASGTFVPGLVDAFKLAQRPLFLVAPLKRGAWRWEIKTLTRLDAGRFTAELGPVSIEGPSGITHPTARNGNAGDLGR